MTGQLATQPHNHFNCSRGCSPAPLTLADRELITGRGDIQCYDERSRGWYCGDCLADLPAVAYDRLHHVCAAPQNVSVGDTVQYLGSLADYHGTVWKVTHKDERGLVLFDIDRALWNVSPVSVKVLRRGAV